MGFPVKDKALDRLRQNRGRDNTHRPLLLLLEIFTNLQLGAARPRCATCSSGSTAPTIGALHLDGHGARRLRRRRLPPPSPPPEQEHPPRGLRRGGGRRVGREGDGPRRSRLVPSPLGEVIDYAPSFTEFCVSAGIWAAGRSSTLSCSRPPCPSSRDPAHGGGSALSPRRPSTITRGRGVVVSRSRNPPRWPWAQLAAACQPEVHATSAPEGRPAGRQRRRHPRRPRQRHPPRRQVHAARRPLRAQSPARLPAHRHQALRGGRRGGLRSNKISICFRVVCLSGDRGEHDLCVGPRRECPCLVCPRQRSEMLLSALHRRPKHENGCILEFLVVEQRTIVLRFEFYDHVVGHDKRD